MPAKGRRLAGLLHCSALTVLSGLAVAAPAHAQTQTTSTPVRQFTDGNGVDLLSGTFTTTTGVAIGDGETGLAFTRDIRGVFALDNLLGEILISGSTYTVSLASSAEKFTLSGGVFTPSEQNGSTLTPSGSNYTYRRDDGTTVAFEVPATSYAFGNAKGIMPTSITYPSGKVLTFSYAAGQFVQSTQGGPVTIYGRRLASVTSNTGYNVTFSYENDTPSSSALHLWMNVTNVVTGNTVVSCGTGCTAASLAISPLTGGTAGVRDYTDSMNRTTRYTIGTDGVTGIQLRAAPPMTCPSLTRPARSRASPPEA